MTQRNPTSLELAPPLLMGTMMVTLAVEPDRFNSPWGEVQLRQAIRRCHRCEGADACRRWLRDPLRDPGEYRGFCANAGLFDRYGPVRS